MPSLETSCLAPLFPHGCQVTLHLQRKEPFSELCYIVLILVTTPKPFKAQRMTGTKEEQEQEHKYHGFFPSMETMIINCEYYIYFTQIVSLQLVTMVGNPPKSEVGTSVVSWQAFLETLVKFPMVIIQSKNRASTRGIGRNSLIQTPRARAGCLYYKSRDYGNSGSLGSSELSAI